MSTGAWALWGQRLSHSPLGLNHPAQCHTCRCSVQVWAKKDHPWGMNVEGGTERYIENQRISESKRIAFPFPNQWEDRIPSSAHSHIPRPNHSQAACPRGLMPVHASASALPASETWKLFKLVLWVISLRIFEKSFYFYPIFAQNYVRSS